MKDFLSHSNKASKWAEILKKNGVEFPSGKEQISIRCPFHEDRHPSLGINLRIGKWICRSGCGSGDLSSFISKLIGKEFSFQGEEFLEDDWLLQENSEEKEFTAFLPKIHLPFKIGAVPEWIFERGFTKEELSDWKCGTSDEGSLAIPIYDSRGDAVGWVCRREKGKEPRYVYTKGLQTSKIIFGQYNLLGHSLEFLCITEGPLDTIWLTQHGFSSVALFGVNLSSHQEHLLSQIKTQEVVLCLDSDEPGKAAIRKISPRLEKRFVVSYIDIPEDCKDVQDIRDAEKLKQVIKNRKLFGGI